MTQGDSGAKPGPPERDFYETEAELQASERWTGPARMRCEFIVEMLQGIKFSSVLDVGCGDGLLLNTMARPARFCGIDLAFAHVSKAQRLLPDGKFAVGSATELPFVDEAFDLVCCSEVLEHIREADRAAEELFRIARKYVLITTPNCWPVVETLCPHCKKLFFLDGHLTYFDRQRLRDIGMKNGAKLLKMRSSARIRAGSKNGLSLPYWMGAFRPSRAVLTRLLDPFKLVHTRPDSWIGALYIKTDQQQEQKT